MTSPHFPDKGILWRVWNDDTRLEISQRKSPILLFVLDRHPAIRPHLKPIFETMPANAGLRELLRKDCLGLLVEGDALPEEMKRLGAGSRYQIAILSPYGLTPMAVFDPAKGTPAETIDEIVVVLGRLLEAWR